MDGQPARQLRSVLLTLLLAAPLAGVANIPTVKFTELAAQWPARRAAPDTPARRAPCAGRTTGCSNCAPHRGGPPDCSAAGHARRAISSRRPPRERQGSAQSRPVSDRPATPLPWRVAGPDTGCRLGLLSPVAALQGQPTFQSWRSGMRPASVARPTLSPSNIRSAR